MSKKQDIEVIEAGETRVKEPQIKRIVFSGEALAAIISDSGELPPGRWMPSWELVDGTPVIVFEASDSEDAIEVADGAQG